MDQFRDHVIGRLTMYTKKEDFNRENMDLKSKFEVFTKWKAELIKMIV